ncbi:hypothetical protein LAZ40_14595 [Cereibacter sphaeroides]|uniref:hypothetical protein n=1 Tax=Cereibacter sphaeroides TaxID=1063 RepID=UPI001F34015C|nr:hypothetical protein [Cereibacter sphaeroides]MCE6960252.1 hypothetical protein [Cereibacter sphaeroides]MCE6974863.1 hypothetical protein [Cereibacter sphaeroides]
MTSLALSTFDFHGNDIRTVIIDDQPWFAGPRVAELLGHAQPARRSSSMSAA